MTSQFSLTPDDPGLDPLAGSGTESVSSKIKIKSDFGGFLVSELGIHSKAAVLA